MDSALDFLNPCDTVFFMNTISAVVKSLDYNNMSVKELQITVKYLEGMMKEHEKKQNPKLCNKTKGLRWIKENCKFECREADFYVKILSEDFRKVDKEAAGDIRNILLEQNIRVRVSDIMLFLKAGCRKYL